MIAFIRLAGIQKSLFLLCMAHFMLDFFTGIWPIYKTIARIDLAEAGFLIGLAGFLGESLQLCFGYFCDKGYRKMILILGLVLGSFILWIPFSQSSTSLFVLLFLLTLGSSSFHPAGAGFAGGFTSSHKAKTILLFSAFGMLGLAVSQLIFTFILDQCNGHALCLFLPLFILLIFLSSHKFPDLQISSTFSHKQLFSTFSKTKKPIIYLYLTQITNYSLVLSFLFLLPDLLQHKNCHPWLVMGGGHFCYILGSAIALPPAGYLCDRLGQRKILLAVIILSIFFFYLLLQLPNLSTILGVLLLFCLGSCMNSINPIVVSWGHRLLPNNPSTVSALFMGFAWCFANLGPMFAGLICTSFLDHSVQSTLYCLGFLLLFTLTFTLLMPSTKSLTEAVDSRTF